MCGHFSENSTLPSFYARQHKTVQARITKSSLWAVPCTEVFCDMAARLAAGGMTDGVARHVSFGQISCLFAATSDKMKSLEIASGAAGFRNYRSQLPYVTSLGAIYIACNRVTVPCLGVNASKDYEPRACHQTLASSAKDRVANLFVVYFSHLT